MQNHYHTQKKKKKKENAGSHTQKKRRRKKENAGSHALLQGAVRSSAPVIWMQI